MNKLKALFSLTIIVLLLLTVNSASAAKRDTISKTKQTFILGLRFQKAAGFYWSNGITVEYTNEKILKQKVSLGFNFISSKLGTALNSNAIPFYEIDISGIKYFRQNKSLKPLFRLNLGYAHANYGSDIFNDITDQSLLISIEAGAAYDFKFPLRIALSGGYNLIKGNGEKGLGVIYPVYAQCSLIYRMFPKKRSNHLND